MEIKMRYFNVSPLSISDKILTHGRTFYEGETLALPWSASGLSVRFVGNSIAFRLSPYDCSADGHTDVIFRLEIDGVSTKSSVGAGSVVVFADGLDDCEHEARLLKCTETTNPVFISGVQVLGESPEILVCEKEYSMRLEVIGDSITCGYGTLGKSDTFYAFEEDATRAYAFMTGEKLSADTRLISWSGRGIVQACNGERMETFGDFFTWKARVKSYGDHDFSEWQPDVVVVNGGTNDYNGGLRAPEFAPGVKELYALIRSVYPNAKIIFFYGAMGEWFNDVYRSLVAEFNETDSNVYFLPTAANFGKADEIGSNGHPSLMHHVRMSNELFEAINKIM